MEMYNLNQIVFFCLVSLVIMSILYIIYFAYSKSREAKLQKQIRKGFENSKWEIERMIDLRIEKYLKEKKMNSNPS